MIPFVALTLKLSPGSLNKYLLEMDLRLELPGRQITVQQLPPPGVAVHLPLASLLTYTSDATAYGSQLSAALFRETVAQTALKVARTHADAAKLPLHVSLDVSACPPEIQSLRWETLQDVEPDRVGWAFSERLLLSRRLASSDMVPVEPRNRPARSALIAISDPSDLHEYGFSAIPVAAELERAHAALHSLRRDVIARQSGAPCTIQRLLTAMRSGPDVVCLVAHGQSVDGEVHLWLENDLGQSAPVPSRELVAHLTALEPVARPLLIIFATCESGGADASGMPVSAIGPMLASQGVAAILAMQGRLSFATNAAFLPAVLREVLRDGVIDRAVAAARVAVAKHTDWWTPILWLRLPHGQLWAPRSQSLQNSLPASRGVGSMNYTRGFTALKECLAQTSPDEVAAVTVLEARFKENERSEQLFGSTEITRSERARIVFSLEQIALNSCGVSFSELCHGRNAS